MALIKVKKTRSTSKIKVCIVKSRSVADLLVCEVKSRSAAQGSDALWCYVTSESVSTATVCFVTSRSVAELRDHNLSAMAVRPAMNCGANLEAQI